MVFCYRVLYVQEIVFCNGCDVNLCMGMGPGGPILLLEKCFLAWVIGAMRPLYTCKKNSFL